MTLCVFALKKTAGICGCHKIGKDGLAVCVLTRSVPISKKDFKIKTGFNVLTFLGGSCDKQGYFKKWSVYSNK
jgi:hypothetical protein